MENSITDSDVMLHDAINAVYIITESGQTVRHSGVKHFSNGIFNKEMSKFLLNEWENIITLMSWEE